jgi:transposase InsO family protein
VNRGARRRDDQQSAAGRTVIHSNAVAESFFATIKTELLDRQARATRTRRHQAIFEWIEGWYNTRRRHSTLDYLNPAAYEATADTTARERKVA